MFDVIEQGVIQLMTQLEATTSLRAYPSNYQGSITGSEFFRFHIIGPRTSRLNSGAKKIYRGVLKVSFFAPAGGGNKRGFQIGKQIATLIDHKTLVNELSFSVGSLDNYGLDSVLKSHWRVDYTNNFLISGE